MGLGLFGGGVDTVRFLVNRGAIVTVTDIKREEELRSSIQSLEGLPVEYHLGGHRKEDFTRCDLVIVSPAVKKDSPYIHLAKSHGIEIETAINIFFRECPARIIGVTGSNGKSTTATILAEILRGSGAEVRLSGNIGRVKLLEDIEGIGPDDLVVLELSSFQLQDLSRVRRSPHISIVTNISANHLDYHSSLEEYAEAKFEIVRYQNEGDVCFLRYEDSILRKWKRRTKGQTYFFSRNERLGEGTWIEGTRIISRLAGRDFETDCLDRVSLPGEHNIENILAAVGAAVYLGVDAEDIEKVATSFRGLEHRLELVGERGGVRFYNDSKATTPESGITALRCFRRPILIAGGYDKHLPLKAFAEEAARRAKEIMLIGQTASKIKEIIEAAQKIAKPPLYLCASLEEAVGLAFEKATPGDVVLFSPAAASYDMFSNFEERGKRFRQLVREKIHTRQPTPGK